MNKIIAIHYLVYMTKDGSRTRVKIYRKHGAHEYHIWENSVLRLQDAINDLLDANKIRVKYHRISTHGFAIFWEIT